MITDVDQSALDAIVSATTGCEIAGDWKPKNQCGRKIETFAACGRVFDADNNLLNQEKKTDTNGSQYNAKTNANALRNHSRSDLPQRATGR